MEVLAASFTLVVLATVIYGEIIAHRLVETLHSNHEDEMRRSTVVGEVQGSTRSAWEATIDRYKLLGSLIFVTPDWAKANQQTLSGLRKYRTALGLVVVEIIFASLILTG